MDDYDDMISKNPKAPEEMNGMPIGTWPLPGGNRQPLFEPLEKPEIYSKNTTIQKKE